MWLRSWLGKASEPHILFPAIAVVLVGVVWIVTLSLNAIERVNAEEAAVASSRELTETYEAQILRSLREIDQALKIVKYAYEQVGEQNALLNLKDRALLPPDFLFIVSLSNAKGDSIASTRLASMKNVADRDYFYEARDTDTLIIGQPEKNTSSGEWRLHFSRRLLDHDGSFAGIVCISVDTAYFVSGYEASKLGAHGVLGLLGSDGVFRARRTGESIFSGEKADYAALVPNGVEENQSVLSTSTWDRVRRYISARPLYDFPFAVIVGLSEDEQLAETNARARQHLIWAGIASVLLIVFSAIMGRISWQLAQSRLRAAQEQIAHAERVEKLAYHDILTNLPNRSLFSKLLGQGIQQAHRYNKQLAVLFLDLDRFKHINDTLGHEAGDQLLQEVAKRLKLCLRDSDTVARLGGDEFVVMLPELVEEKYVVTVAQKILAATASPFTLLGQEFRITVSIGISTYPQDGQDEQTLTKNADIAMYQAKAEGKNNFQFYSEKLNANSLERLALESSLRHALDRNEFQLHYQAKRDINSSRITGMEALLRWNHPDLGVLAPMQFIPVAEETGLILAIGKWVLKTACLQNVAWQKLGLPRVNMAVNLTARQFADEHLLEDIALILNATGMDGELLEIEINESLLMLDVKKTLQVLSGLKAMGIKIAVDDFGTGYTSLATLKQFPLDTIKIDRSFIRGVTNNALDKGLTDAIITMGRALSLTLVAQGIETKDQADFLRQRACDEFQGFYFSMPVPADEFEVLLRANQQMASSEHRNAA